MGSKNVKIRNVFIDHHKFLGTHENSLEIYDSPPGKMILSPFNFEFDSIDKLLVLNFEDDPIYFRIELQISREFDKNHPLVILYRKDNMVDIYYTNKTAIRNRKKHLTDLFPDVSFNQLENIEFKFKFEDSGLDAYLFLEDKLEKEIEFRIKEKSSMRKLTAILAPMDITNKKPEYFPIFFLNQFGMVTKKNSEILIQIHGFPRQVAEIPLKINNEDVYAAHYSLNPVFCKWNCNYSDNIDPIILNALSLSISEKNIEYELKNNSDYYEIKKISGKDSKEHIVSFEFSPAIPNFLNLKTNFKISGRFSCIIDENKGVFGGNYYLNRTEDYFEFVITPSKGWQLSFGKLWVKSYRWIAVISLRDNTTYKIESSWCKTTG
ncbi:MAG: hypothetical protein ACFE96_00015 [Candidatus Hermodarchaeota archaeon]